jgi:hypothetical protein
MPAAPPAADTKKPATPPPAKTDDKSKGGDAKAAGGDKGGEKKPPGPSTGQEKGAAGGGDKAAAPAGGGKAAAPASGDKAAGNAGQQRFDRMAVRAKLAVSEPGDPIEREADQIADKVMRMAEPAPEQAQAGGAAAAKPDQLKRKEQPENKKKTAFENKAAPEKPADGAATKTAAGPEGGEDEGGPRNEIKRKEHSSGGGTASDSAQSSADRPATAQDLMTRLGPGDPLDADTRAFFEKRMNCDLSEVRIHTDTAAAQAAAQLHARAFTYGNHIAFASGAYQPQSASGKQLIAHELAHVVHHSSGTVSRKIMRQTAGGAAGSDFEVTHAELEIPPIKARHVGGYQKLAKAGALKRKGNYDASTRGTKQIQEWTKNVKIDLNKIPAARRPTTATGFNLNLELAGGASSKVIPASSQDELIRNLQIPTWGTDGSDKTFQVDHQVEYQLGGADAIDNMELLDQAHNGSIGSSLSHGIKRTVREEVQKDPTKPALSGYTGHRTQAGEPSAEGVMTAMTVVFREVKGRARESKRKEGGSMFWSKEQIEALDHVLPQLGATGNLEGTAKSFALLSPTGNLMIAKIPHGSGKTEIKIGDNQAGGMAGFKMKRLVLTDGYNDAPAGNNIGTLEGVLDFGPAVAIPKENVSVGVSQAQSPGKYSGKVGSNVTGLPNEVEFKPMSPLQLSGITFGKGIFSSAMLKPTHPVLEGISIPGQIQNGKLGIFYTLDTTTLAQKLKIPGVQIDSAGITFSYDGKVFKVGGGTEFTIQKFGSGFLNASVDSDENFELEGGFHADNRLFDQVDMKLWYRSQGGFGGSGTFAITNPDKIKGIKSAKLSAKYEDSVFSATGEVMPSIPGLASASLSVTYGNDTLQITGKVAIDDKVPGVEAADITVTVTQANDAWKVAANGSVTPKLPGLSGATLNFAYDEGFVLIEGEFEIKKGPLDGKVKAGVTNAAVDEKGVRAEKGEGDGFKVFGSADIKAEFIKGKLDGLLKLRLLPDGSVRVGGGLAVKDFELFGQIPEDGGKHYAPELKTPRIPVPGLGFSVGSVSVGLTIGAALTAWAQAAIGPGKMTVITLVVEEFDPANIDFNTLEIGGGATFQVFGAAGFGVGASVGLRLSAGVAYLDGEIGVEGSVGIPDDVPILTIDTKFTYSQAKGLDILGKMSLDISPELKFAVTGRVTAELELLVTTVTVWSRDFTIGEANFKLPIGIKAAGELGYNSKTGKLTPEDPSESLKVEEPDLSAESMTGILMGDSRPSSVKTTDENGKELTDDELTWWGMPLPDQSETSSDPDQTFMAKREDGAEVEPGITADEGIVNRIGPGIPLDLATRGYFEQRLGTDFADVRIHSGPAAAREAKAFSAKAFTVGDHIAFAEGAFQPKSTEGQELIAHELAHVAQQKGGGEPIVLRWPAVTRGKAQTSETPATIKGKTLSDFMLLTQTQLDWATSKDLQADAAALAQFRDIQTFAEGPNITEACGDLNTGDIINKGVPAVYPALRKYTEGVMSGSTAWLRRTGNMTKAERWGRELTRLETAWPAANLSLVMRAPDPVNYMSPFEQLDDPAKPKLTEFINYLGACSPTLSAENGKEVRSFLKLSDEGVVPESYKGKIKHVTNYHHFTKDTLDGLVKNEAWPPMLQQWSVWERPLTVVLYPSVDHNGAFHRNLGLQEMVQEKKILTIVLEGYADIAGYRDQLAGVAARYGIDGEISQVMIGGHGNADHMTLAGTATGSIKKDHLGTTGAAGTSTADLMKELTRLMSTDPKKRRIVLDACLTNSHDVATALRKSPADAAADVNNAIAANPNLRDVVAKAAGVGADVRGASASFYPSETKFMTPGTTDIGLSVPGDPDVIGTKLQYVEFGTEPEGCMRAVLECWATDQLAGTNDCRDAMRRRIAAGKSTHVATVETWNEAIIQPLYDLAANNYWGDGETIRQMTRLSGQLFELRWKGHTEAGPLNNSLLVFSSAAHVDKVLGSMAGDPHYAATPRVALVLEQAWMQYTPARRAQFLIALGRYRTCLEARDDLDMPLVMPHVPLLLTLPPAASPPADQLKLALLATNHDPLIKPYPSPLPAHITFLRSLLGRGPTFPSALGIDGVLGGLYPEKDVLLDIGRPLTGGGTSATGSPTPPSANIDTVRDRANLNDFRVAPLRQTGVVATTKDKLMVRSSPTTATKANIFAALAAGTSVTIIGETGDWYAIEQPGRSGFVAKSHITVAP